MLIRSATKNNYQLNRPITMSTDLQIDAPGHHQRGQEQVGHGQRHDEVIGGGLQRFLSGHGHTHQNVAKHHAKNQQHQQNCVEVIWWRRGRRRHRAVRLRDKRGQGRREGGKRRKGKRRRRIWGRGSAGDAVFSHVENRHNEAPLGTWEDMKLKKSMPKITIMSLFTY